MKSEIRMAKSEGNPKEKVRRYVLPPGRFCTAVRFGSQISDLGFTALIVRSWPLLALLSSGPLLLNSRAASVLQRSAVIQFGAMESGEADRIAPNRSSAPRSDALDRELTARLQELGFTGNIEATLERRLGRPVDPTRAVSWICCLHAHSPPATSPAGRSRKVSLSAWLPVAKLPALASYGHGLRCDLHLREITGI